jgi:hypothetical protein
LYNSAACSSLFVVVYLFFFEMFLNVPIFPPFDSDFGNIRLGPHLPSWMAPYLAPGGFNGVEVFINGTNSVVVCPFPFEYNPPQGSDLWCSNENVVARAPDHGPKEGGTTVHVELNGFAAYHDIGCSFGYYEEGDLAHLVSVVPGSVNVSDYYWQVRFPSVDAT